jgi:hypothetical protein
MAFPTTGVLDDFNRADGVVGSAWTKNPMNSGADDLEIVSNRVRPATPTDSEVYWNANTFGPDSEVYWTVVTQPAGTENAGSFGRMRLVDPSASSSTVDGYSVEFYDGASNFIFRVDNAVQTQLGATIVNAFSSGVQVGGSVVGSTISVFENGVAIDTRTDSAYTAAGYISLGGYDSATRTLRLDDFGGGTFVPDPVPGSNAPTTIRVNKSPLRW